VDTNTAYSSWEVSNRNEDPLLLFKSTVLKLSSSGTAEYEGGPEYRGGPLVCEDDILVVLRYGWEMR
jgi:hypothetical protein